MSNIININGCQYGCDCESCSGWLLSPQQRAIAEWFVALEPDEWPMPRDNRHGCLVMGRSGGGGGEDSHISRSQGPSTK